MGVLIEEMLRACAVVCFQPYGVVENDRHHATRIMILRRLSRRHPSVTYPSTGLPINSHVHQMSGPDLVLGSGGLRALLLVFLEAWQNFLGEKREVVDSVLMVEEAGVTHHQEIAHPAAIVAEFDD